MDSNNPVITLCIEGIWAELEHRHDDARHCYQQAWNACTDEYEACIAAHYVARVQDIPEKKLSWNLRALELAYAVKEEWVRDFYPSLFMSIGHSYKQLGGTVQAQRYYRLAASMGEVQSIEAENDMLKWLKAFDWIQPLIRDSV